MCWPIHITNFAIYKQSFILPRVWFCYPCWWHTWMGTHFWRGVGPEFWNHYPFLTYDFSHSKTADSTFFFFFSKFSQIRGTHFYGFFYHKNGWFYHFFFCNFCYMGPSSKDFFDQNGTHILVSINMWVPPGAAHPSRVFCSEYPPA